MTVAPTRDHCIFCRIVAGTARSHPVWEDSDTLAFMDLAPLATGHVLVIPKPHWENVFETPVPALGAVMDTVKRVAHAIRATIAPPGLGVYQGEPGGRPARPCFTTTSTSSPATAGCRSPSTAGGGRTATSSTGSRS